MKKRFNLIPLFVVLIVLFLTIGYSAFQNAGIIGDITATVRPNMDIKITDLQIESTSDGIVVSKDHNTVNNQNNTYTGKIISDLTFTKTSSQVTFKVEVTNFGNTETAVASISGLPSNLTYELDTTTYDVGQKLCDKTTPSKCTLGSKTDIYVTIKYKDGSGSNESTNLSIVLDLTFKGLHKIYYGGNAIDYVIDGGNKTVSLGNNAPNYVQVSGAYSSKSYVKPNVTLTGVTSNIIIEEIHKIYVDNVEQQTVAVHGGNVTINLGTSAPSDSSKITISGTYSNSSYSNPNLTINGINTDINITIATSGGNGGTWEAPVEDNTVLVYDPSNVPEGTTVYNEAPGKPKATADANGHVTEFAYTDPDGITLNNSTVDTGMIVFDGQGFEMDLVFKAKLGENTGNNIWGAIQHLGTKYAGFNMSVRSNTFVWISGSRNGSLYAASGAVGSSLHSSSSGFRVYGTYNSVTEYTVHFVYLPPNYGTNTNNYSSVVVSFSPTSSGTGITSPYTVPKSYDTYIPTSLSDATFTLGGNGINTSYDMINFQVESFHVRKI